MNYGGLRESNLPGPKLSTCLRPVGSKTGMSFVVMHIRAFLYVNAPNYHSIPGHDNELKSHHTFIEIEMI
jgi:hypothetical protein